MQYKASSIYTLRRPVVMLYTLARLEFESSERTLEDLLRVDMPVCSSRRDIALRKGQRVEKGDIYMVKQQRGERSKGGDQHDGRSICGKIILPLPPLSYWHSVPGRPQLRLRRELPLPRLQA